MQKEGSVEVNEGGGFEIAGTLTYNPEFEKMLVDVESLGGHWPLGGDAPEVVHVTCRCGACA
jgi:hypothetical protein